MFRFLLGFGMGVCVGTYYDCKPIINEIRKMADKYAPKEKRK